MQETAKPVIGVLTNINTTYHQNANQQPTRTEGKFTRRMTTEQQPYSRNGLKIGEEWARVDLGWIEGGIGLITIGNDEGRGLVKIPTPDELEATRAKVLEILVGKTVGDPWLIPPTESFTGTPSANVVYIRCQRGTARVSVTIYPK